MQQRCEECGKMIAYEREMKSIACAYCYTEFRVNPDGRLIAAGDDMPFAQAAPQDADYAAAEKRERTRLNRLMEEGTDQHLTFIRETQMGGGPGGPGGPRVGTVMPAPGEVGMAGGPGGPGALGPQNQTPVIQPPKSMEQLEFNPMTGEVERPAMARRQQTSPRPQQQGAPATKAPMAQRADSKAGKKDEIKFATFDTGASPQSRKQVLIIVAAIAVLGCAVAAAMFVIDSGQGSDNRGGGFSFNPGTGNSSGGSNGSDPINANDGGSNASTVSIKLELDAIETLLSTCNRESVANAIAALTQASDYLQRGQTTSADRDRVARLRPIASALYDKLLTLDIASWHIDQLEAGSPDDALAARYDRKWSEFHLARLTAGTAGDRPWDQEVRKRANAAQARLTAAIAQYPAETW